MAKRQAEPSSTRADGALGARRLRPAAGAGALLGLLLIAMAVPRLVAAVVDLPAERVVFYIRHGHPVTDAALDGLVAARRAALGWHEDGPGWRELAAAELELIRRGEEARQQAAADAVRRSLELAPVDPFAWARLAHLAWLRDGDTALAAEALRVSIEVGSYEPRLGTWRARMIARLWPHGDARQRAVFAAHLRELKRREPEALAAARADPQAAAVLAELLDTAGANPRGWAPPRPQAQDGPR